MIAFDGVSRDFGGNGGVRDLSFCIARGEFCALIGPSGSGKSTALRLMNRLLERAAGRIRIGDTDIDGLAPEALRRRMGYAIQSVGLFPHWSVARNIATVPRLLGWPERRVQARVAEMMHLLRLDETMASRRPHQLSGGQAQRVGVARALAADPDVLLLDEPFGALDPVTRSGLRDELARIHQATGKTIVLVTHDMDEALALAQRLLILRDGRVAQSGTPADILAAPADSFVSDLLGDSPLRRLSVATLADCLRPEPADGEPLPAGASLRDALEAMLARGVLSVPVADAQGNAVGSVRLEDLVRREGAPG